THLATTETSSLSLHAALPISTIPVVITVYEDRTFTFVTKSPPAAVLIKQALALEKGSAEPHREKVGRLSRDQLRQIAEKKMQDRSEEHTSELQSPCNLVCRLL